MHITIYVIRITFIVMCITGAPAVDPFPFSRAVCLTAVPERIITVYRQEDREHMKNEKSSVSFPSLSELEKELEREDYKGKYKRTLRSTVSILLVTAAIVVLMSFLIFPVFRIYGSSMNPTVNEGEIVVSVKGSRFDCGDVVVLSYNNKLLVKRVIAGPGDWFDMDRDGNVYVNGEKIDEPYLTDKAYGDCNIALPFQVPEGRYFVLGDNRSVSQDSRNTAVGCIADEQIVGRAVLRIWPLSEFGIFERY